MFFWDFIFALAMALVVSVIFGLIFRRTGAWPGIFFFFLIIFLFSWAGGIWLTPFGPAVAGTYWLPFLMVGLFIAILLAAAIPPPRPRRGTAVVETTGGVEEATALGVFFWFLVIVLIIAIAVRYF